MPKVTSLTLRDTVRSIRQRNPTEKKQWLTMVKNHGFLGMV